MKKILSSIISFIFSLLVYSQGDDPNQLKLPNILPPSPEAAALNKAGQLSVGLMTGTAHQHYTE